MEKKRKRSDKSKYVHESTGEQCTCAAYVAEIMCRKNAENKNVGSLPYKFWSKKPWDWTFKRQLFAANKLLKDFSEKALVRAVNSPDFRGIFSLNHPNCTKILKKYEKIIKAEEAQPKQEIELKADPKRRKKSYGKKNLLSKMRKFENGEKEN